MYIVFCIWENINLRRSSKRLKSHKSNIETSGAIIICNFKINYFDFKFYCRRNWRMEEEEKGDRQTDRQTWEFCRQVLWNSELTPLGFWGLSISSPKETNAIVLAPACYCILHFNFEKTLGMFEIPTKANNVSPVFICVSSCEGMIPFFM